MGITTSLNSSKAASKKIVIERIRISSCEIPFLLWLNELLIVFAKFNCFSSA